MSKLSSFIAATALSSLASCIPPEPPPPRFQPNPPFPPQPVDPYGSQTDISPPPAPSQPAPSQPAPPPGAAGGFPTATRTADPDQVLSPYEPYNVIDVAGFKSGQLARDPSNQKIFRVP